MAENNTWYERQQRKLRDARRNDARRRAAIREAMTTEQQAADDESQDIIDLYAHSRSTSRQSPDDMARELEEFQAEEVARSPTPSPSSTETEALLPPQDNEARRAVCGSSAVPMGVYPPKRRPTLQVNDENASEDKDFRERGTFCLLGLRDIFTCLPCRRERQSPHGPLASVGN
ncbi:hypothetical protein EJ07DRAFT_184559 [Lizonia empirigonia]|nr:hypothetical protein EJ07DRAFT_184559 [Lizonia empirigonia]